VFIALLVAYHILFFWRIYSNPFSVARSELLSTFFPSWVHLGRGEKDDKYFWGNYDAHPVLSPYYPFQFLGAKLIKTLSLNQAFKVLAWLVSLHHLFASIGWYYLVLSWSNQYVALFGAVTLTYAGYTIKQQPCIVYTIAWFPWLLLGIATNNKLLALLSLGMVLLAGYYPIGLQIILIAIGAAIMWGAHPWFVPMGFLIGLPQLIPFLKHLPKTIRANQHDDIGKVPWWHFISLLKPIRSNINGVGYWEMSYYIGLIPLILIPFATSRVWPLALIAALLMMGCLAQYLPRIPARWSFTFQFALGWMATSGFNNLCIDSTLWLSLILLQAFDLYWNNSKLLVTEPYSELPQRPSWAFNTPLTRYLEANLGDNRVSGLPYPLFTGHINKLKTLGYSGGMQTKLMARLRNDTNPNGSGEHDWFRSNQDDERLTAYEAQFGRVAFAFSRKVIDKWLGTGIRDLYRNPRV